MCVKRKKEKRNEECKKIKEDKGANVYGSSMINELDIQNNSKKKIPTKREIQKRKKRKCTTHHSEAQGLKAVSVPLDRQIIGFVLRKKERQREKEV